jgi:hypothetical protein
VSGGAIQVASATQITGSTVGDIAGVVLRDNMIVVQRPDIGVPMEVRREQLTQRFVQGLGQLSAERKVVLFFSVTEKMSDLTYQWVWEQLLKPVLDGALPNVRAILLGQRPPPADRDLAEFIACAQLKPLAADDIEAYIAKRAEGAAAISEETRRELANMLHAMTRGRPADVSAAVDLYLASKASS